MNLLPAMPPDVDRADGLDGRIRHSSGPVEVPTPAPPLLLDPRGESTKAATESPANPGRPGRCPVFR